MFVNGAISWLNKMLEIVAHSTIMAKYVALAYVISKVLWTKSLAD